MSPWLIAGLCLAGAGFIAWGSAWLRMRWPLAVLSLLLAAVAVQLLLAARGTDGFHDLAALIAQVFTVTPALIGVATGLAVARVRGYGVRMRGPVGLLTAAGLLIAAAAVTASLLL